MTARRLPAALLAFAASAAAGQVEVNGIAVPTLRIGGVEYAQLYRVVGAAGGRYWRVGERFICVLPGDSAGPENDYVFTADSAYALHLGERTALPAPPRLEDGQLLIPALCIAGMFPDGGYPTLRTIETVRQADTVVLRLGFGTRPLADTLRYISSASSSLEFRLSIGATADSAFEQQLRLLSLTGGTGIVRSVARESAAATVLLLKFRQPAAQEVRLRDGGIDVAVWPRPLRSVRKVVIDPGHGGQDPGAVGRIGTQEKNLTLDVARRVRQKLTAAGIDVVMTRDTDVYVSLAQRAWIAESTRADLFLSIHVNAAPNRAACGLETYFLSEARTDWERAVAARENAALEMDLPDSSTVGGDQLGLILADLAQNEYLIESSDLAVKIQEVALASARLKDRGVRQAGFYVLRNNYMPATLVECGFITNKAEEKLLRKADHRERIAKGIAQGVKAFVKLYEKRVNGS